MLRWTPGTATAALLLLANSALANDAPPPIGSIEPAALVQQLDRNGNACLDLEEGRNYTSRRFHQLDANDDNTLDASEAPPLPGEPSEARPISIEAWQDAYTARFSSFDADANGCLSAEEITRGRAAAATGGAQ